MDLCSVAFECSGSVGVDGICAEVCKDGHSLRIFEDWQRQLDDFVLVCHKLLKLGSTAAISNGHPRRVALEQALPRFRPKISFSICIEALLKLPFAVRKDVQLINKSIIPFKGKSIKIVHADLKSLTSHYGQENEDKEFAE